MHHYFGIEPYSFAVDFNKWIASDNRVVVLRDPIERIISTLAAGYIEMFVLHTCPYLSNTGWDYGFIFNLPDSSLLQKIKDYDFNTKKIKDYDFSLLQKIKDYDFSLLQKIKDYDFNTKKIKDYDFRVIDFAKLEQYIPRPAGGIQSPRTDSIATSNLAKLYYVPNDTYTLRELEQECEDYMYLMSHRKHLSVEEWKELTL